MSRLYPMFRCDIVPQALAVSGIDLKALRRNPFRSLPREVQFRKGHVRWQRSDDPRGVLNQDGNRIVPAHFALADLKTSKFHLFFQYGFVQSRGLGHIVFPSFPFEHTDTTYLALLYAPQLITSLSIEDYYGSSHPMQQMLDYAQQADTFWDSPGALVRSQLRAQLFATHYADGVAVATHTPVPADYKVIVSAGDESDV